MMDLKGKKFFFFFKYIFISLGEVRKIYGEGY